MNDLNRAAILCKKQDGRYAYIAPYYVQAKDVAWTYLKRYSAPFPGVQINESELRVDYPNGARVRLYGADNADRLRGGYLDGVILDEYADMAPSVWGEVIRPMLADRKGWGVFIGTPKGKGALWDIWNKSNVEDDWFALMLKASSSGLISPAELEDARREMTPEQYEQEFECSFDAAILGAYYAKEIADAEREGRVTDAVLFDPSLKVQTAWDLGMNNAMALWVFQVGPDGVRVLDYFENSNQKIAFYLQELVNRGHTVNTHWWPHDGEVRELTTGRSRIETMEGLLGTSAEVRKVPNLGLMDGINAARVSFGKMWLNKTRCAYGIEALRQYRNEFDEKKKVFRNAPLHDWTSNCADAFRYMALAWRHQAVALPAKTKPIAVQLHGIADPTGTTIKSSLSFDDILRQKRRAAKARE